MAARRTILIRSGKDLGRALAQVRQSSGLTQVQLAEELTFDRTYLARMESGLSVLLFERAIWVFRLLGAEVTVTLPEVPVEIGKPRIQSATR